jgi:ryanodine receptor 2
MKTNNYTPQPIDTSAINLPNELNPLVEQMAKNVHEVWAAARIAEGWTYGEKRNDDKKTHPCLVSYEELPESEKEYDRKTGLETLKFIIRAGYQIEKKQ